MGYEHAAGKYGTLSLDFETLGREGNHHGRDRNPKATFPNARKLYV